MSWLDKLDRKFGRWGIRTLMLYIVITIAAVFIGDVLFSVQGMSLSGYLALFTQAAVHGQFWRFVTFIFVPPTTSIISLFFFLYFYYFLGSTLENVWGTFRFNLYYLVGLIGAVIAAFFTGYGTSTYLNLSLFLAFAFLFPDHEILLFFFFPIKMKYLAYVDWILFAVQLIFGDWSTKAAIIASLINFFLFFGGDLIRFVKNQKKYGAQRRNFRREMKNNQNRYW